VTATLVEQLPAPGAVTFFDVLGALTVAEKNEIRKVMRVHGRFAFNVNVAQNHVHGRFGLIVAGDAAIAVGTDLPRPIADSGFSWMINDFFADEGDLTTHYIDWDIKAQRVIPNGFTLMGAVELDSASDSNVHWNLGLRLLLEHR